MSNTIKVKILDEKATVPSKAYETDTGYDLTFIGIDKIVGDVVFFKTGIAVQPPSGHYFDIVPRSSISKLPLMLANSIGIIDETYTGELLVALRVMHSNMGHGNERTSWPNGLVSLFNKKPSTMTDVANQILVNNPKLCQLILKKRIKADIEVVESLDKTERGDGGFGSTDTK